MRQRSAKPIRQTDDVDFDDDGIGDLAQADNDKAITVMHRVTSDLAKELTENHLQQSELPPQQSTGLYQLYLLLCLNPSPLM